MLVLNCDKEKAKKLEFHKKVFRNLRGRYFRTFEMSTKTEKFVFYALLVMPILVIYFSFFFDGLPKLPLGLDQYFGLLVIILSPVLLLVLREYLFGSYEFDGERIVAFTRSGRVHWECMISEIERVRFVSNNGEGKNIGIENIRGREFVIILFPELEKAIENFSNRGLS